MDKRTFDQAVALAAEYRRTRRFRDAEAVYRQLLQQSPDHPDLLCALGVVICDAREDDTGLEFIRRAIAICPDQAEYHSHLGLILAKLKRLDEAVAAHRQSVALNRESPLYLYCLAVTLCANEQSDEAIPLCREALGLLPVFPEVYSLMGDCLFDKGNLLEATACYKKAILQNTEGRRLTIRPWLTKGQKEIVPPSLWPDYNGPPLIPEGGAAKAAAINYADCPAAQVHPELAHLSAIGSRQDIPMAAEIFSLDGKKLPCWLDEDFWAADGAWLNAREGYPYYYALFQALAKPDRPLRVMEIGVRTGYVPVTLVKAVQSRVIYVGIDPNLYCADGLVRAAGSLHQLRGKRDNFDFLLIEGYSWDRRARNSLYMSGPYDIIHIDGDHTLPGKLLDLELARRSLAPGGYVLVDDYDYTTHTCVKEAVHRVLATGMYNRFGHVPTFRGLAVLQADGV
jgi:tetratricopeptide (TPR) repeat protein